MALGPKEHVLIAESCIYGWCL